MSEIVREWELCLGSFACILHDTHSKFKMFNFGHVTDDDVISMSHGQLFSLPGPKSRLLNFNHIISKALCQMVFIL